jgi:hypothetical protein
MRGGELAAAAGFVPVRVAPAGSPAVRETKDEPPAAPAVPESTLGTEASIRARQDRARQRARAPGCGADRSGCSGTAGSGPRSPMITVLAGVRVYLALGATNMCAKGLTGFRCWRRRAAGRPILRASVCLPRQARRPDQGALLGRSGSLNRDTGLLKADRSGKIRLRGADVRNIIRKSKG